MKGSPTIPPKIRSILPLCGSSTDGEALGACRAIGRTLGTVGLDFHDLAKAIQTGPIKADNVHLDRRSAPKWDDAQWRSASTRPAPAYRPSRRKASIFTPLQQAVHRRHALWVRNAEGGRLSDKERSFIASVVHQRHELSLAQADWLVDIVDRIDMEDRSQ